MDISYVKFPCMYFTVHLHEFIHFQYEHSPEHCVYFLSLTKAILTQNVSHLGQTTGHGVELHPMCHLILMHGAIVIIKV